MSANARTDRSSVPGFETAADLKTREDRRRNEASSLAAAPAAALPERPEVPRVADCPSTLSPEGTLEAAIETARRGMAAACCPQHGVLGSILLSLQLWKETAASAGLPLREEEIHRIAVAYSSAFRVSQAESAAHAAAMLEAIATVLLLGRTEPAGDRA